MKELYQKRICIQQLELGGCTANSCQYLHVFSHVEVFQLYNVIRDVKNLPSWLKSPRSKIDRLLSIYHLQSAKLRADSNDGPYLTMELLIRILTDIRDLPLNSRDNVFFNCKKLFSDFESLYPRSTFSKVCYF